MHDPPDNHWQCSNPRTLRVGHAASPCLSHHTWIPASLSPCNWSFTQPENARPSSYTVIGCSQNQTLCLLQQQCEGSLCYAPVHHGSWCRKPISSIKQVGTPVGRQRDIFHRSPGILHESLKLLTLSRPPDNHLSMRPPRQIA